MYHRPVILNTSATLCTSRARYSCMSMIGMKKLLFVAAVAVALCLLTATCLAAKAQDQRPARLRIEELPWLKIEDLANSHATVSCVQPLVPMYDRMLHTDAPNNTGTRQIPRMIHVSMKSRCLPPDMAYGVQKWKDALPDHSFYFHDDEAVDPADYYNPSAPSFLVY